MHCNICGKKSDQRICNDCQYFLDHGADETTIKTMLSDERSKKIWQENELIAKELADVYYQSVIENYNHIPKNDSRENFGYNTFVDGIRMGLDITLPMLDDRSLAAAKEKIAAMAPHRKKTNRRLQKK